MQPEAGVVDAAQAVVDTVDGLDHEHGPNQLAYARLVTTSMSQPGRVLQSDQEHHRVLELIVAKDGDSAERVMREHVRASRRALMAGLDRAAGDP